MQYNENFHQLFSEKNHNYLNSLDEKESTVFFSLLKKIVYNDLAILRSPPSAIKDLPYSEISYIWNTHFSHLSDIKMSGCLSELLVFLFKRQSLNDNYAYSIYRGLSIDDYVELTQKYLYFNEKNLSEDNGNSLFGFIKNKVLGIDNAQNINYFDIMEKPDVENFKNSYELIKRYGFNTVYTGAMGNRVSYELISKSKDIFENFLSTLNCIPELVSLNGNLSFSTETRPSILESNYEGYFLPERYKLSEISKELGIISLNVMDKKAVNNYAHELTHAVDFLMGRKNYISAIQKNISTVLPNKFYSEMPEEILNISPKMKSKVAKILDFSYNKSHFFINNRKENAEFIDKEKSLQFIKVIIMRTLKAKNVCHINDTLFLNTIQYFFPEPESFLQNIFNFYTQQPDKTFTDFLNKNEYLFNTIQKISEKLGISIDYDIKERVRKITTNMDSSFLDKILLMPDKFSNSYENLIPVINDNIHEKEYVKYRLNYRERIAFGIGDNFHKNSAVRNEFLSLIRYCIPELKENLVNISGIEEQSKKFNKNDFFLNTDYLRKTNKL